jgi:hypothetical protein
VREALGHTLDAKQRDEDERWRRINEITMRFAARTRLDPRSSTEIMDDLYDADGLPC